MQVFTIPVAPGDVIIAGTDGLFDNLYSNDIAALVVQATRASLKPQVTAQKIAALARQRAQDKNRQTPFSAAAQEAGFRYYGGKLDDITVVVSYITSDHKVCSLRYQLRIIHVCILSLSRHSPALVPFSVTSFHHNMLQLSIIILIDNE